MILSVEIDQEEDGRFIAHVLELPGVMTYGENYTDALRKVQALALRVLADQVENGTLTGGVTIERLTFHLVSLGP